MVMGVGMAMLEATEYDQRSGGPINSSLADYLVAVNADCPQIDVTFLDFPDYNLIRSPPVALAKLGLSVWLRRSRTQSIMQPAFGLGNCRCVLKILSFRLRISAPKFK